MARAYQRLDRSFPLTNLSLKKMGSNMSIPATSMNMSTPLSSHNINPADNRNDDGGVHNPLNHGSSYEQPSPRKASLMALKRIATASENIDDEETAEPSPKRVKTSKSSERQHVYIGWHKEEPRIPIYASYQKSGGVRVRASKENIPEDVLQRWSDFVCANSQVEPKKVRLDGDLHEIFNVDNEKLSNDAIKLFIEEYLESEGKVGKSSGKKTETVPNEPRSTAAELHVGYFKHDEDIPVYAHHTTNASLIFKVHKQDANRSDIEFSGYQIQYEQIIFKDEFVREITEAVKLNIKSCLTQAEIDEQILTDPGAAFSSAHSAEEPSREREPSQLILGEEVINESNNSSPSGQPSTEALFEGQAVIDTIDAFRETAVEILKKYEARLENQTRTIIEQEGTIDAYKKTISEHDATISRQKETIRQLETQLANARKLVHEHPTNQASTQADTYVKTQPFNLASAPDLAIGGRVFGTFPPGDENEGLYVERAGRMVQSGEKHYEEKLVLCGFKLNVGELQGEEKDADGLAFSRVLDGKYEGRLVQKIGSRSLKVHQGRNFVSWLTRKEIPNPRPAEALEL